jgi:ABC-type transport system substrate-binding protein
MTGPRAGLTRRGLLASAAVLGVALPDVAQPGAARAETPKLFVFANSDRYDTLDPHQSFDVARVAVRLNLYDNLYRWEDNPPQLKPWLAESHTISADGLTYTFKLRSGAKFHDGAAVTADDVVYSVERLLGMGKGAAPLIGMMVEKGSTKAPDVATVVFTIKRPAAIFLSAIPELHIVNAKLLRTKEVNGDWAGPWLSSNDAGSGAYMLDSFDPVGNFRAKRFPDHFVGWQGNHLDDVEFRAVLDTSTIVLGMTRGDYSGTDGYLPFEQIERLRRAPDVKILEAESMRLAAIQMNNSKSPFDDVHFRRAIAYAFDYDGMISGILHDSVVRNPVPIPNNCPGFPVGVTGYSFDLDKARAELKLAKSVPDRVYQIAFSSGQVTLQQQAEVLQNGLRQLGIKTELKVLPWASLQPLFRSAETSPDFFSTIISTYYPDPHNWIGEMYSSAAWGTFKSAAYYKNPEVDQLLAQGMASTDPEARWKIYAAAARIVLNDSPGIFIYNTKWFGPYAKNVAGVRFSPIGNGMEMRWASFA